MTNEKRESKMRKKNKKLNGLILKSFIIIAVVIMLLSMTPSQGDKNITKITERLISCYNCY